MYRFQERSLLEREGVLVVHVQGGEVLRIISQAKDDMTTLNIFNEELVVGWLCVRARIRKSGMVPHLAVSHLQVCVRDHSLPHSVGASWSELL